MNQCHRGQTARILAFQQFREAHTQTAAAALDEECFGRNQYLTYIRTVLARTELHHETGWEVCEGCKTIWSALDTRRPTEHCGRLLMRERMPSWTMCTACGLLLTFEAERKHFSDVHKHADMKPLMVRGWGLTPEEWLSGEQMDRVMPQINPHVQKIREFQDLLLQKQRAEANYETVDYVHLKHVFGPVHPQAVCLVKGEAYQLLIKENECKLSRCPSQDRDNLYCVDCKEECSVWKDMDENLEYVLDFDYHYLEHYWQCSKKKGCKREAPVSEAPVNVNEDALQQLLSSLMPDLPVLHTSTSTSTRPHVAAQEIRDVKEVKEVKDAKDAKNGKDTHESNEIPVTVEKANDADVHVNHDDDDDDDDDVKEEEEEVEDEDEDEDEDEEQEKHGKQENQEESQKQEDQEKETTTGTTTKTTTMRKIQCESGKQGQAGYKIESFDITRLTLFTYPGRCAVCSEVLDIWISCPPLLPVMYLVDVSCSGEPKRVVHLQCRS